MATHCEMGLAKVVADLALFLEFSNENVLNPDAAMQALEQSAAELQRLSPDDKHHIAAIFVELSRQYDAENAAFISHLPQTLGLR
ncbi:hypothetical protein MML63_01025 [Kosakonia sacchari]|uniref:hypothetical protein n=1 Tax=Kosakonia sacchari TaxID=1158459 RepID=UPI0025AF1F9B|nr:hypothetical protein [Kosakonia sacchari]MDN2484227.1 hypothetical protein [Kosakonia sacchari]